VKQQGVSLEKHGKLWISFVLGKIREFSWNFIANFISLKKSLV